jgi:NADPH:quinone reductase-like Zn-dependent oxidoreductase
MIVGDRGVKLSPGTPSLQIIGQEYGSRALMRGKTVVITGGTSGIGEVAAETLAKKGARIVLVARDKTAATRVSRDFATVRLVSPTPYTLPISHASPR